MAVVAVMGDAVIAAESVVGTEVVATFGTVEGAPVGSAGADVQAANTTAAATTPRRIGTTVPSSVG